MNRKDLGDLGERWAGEYLQARGYRIRETNYRCRKGEVDIVAQDGDYLVFVEVRTRSGPECGTPEESVTPAKQRQLRRLAQGYLMLQPTGDIPCRFDVVAILYRGPDDVRLEHFTDAF